MDRLVAIHSLDVNTRVGFHTTALHAASAMRNLEVASLLLDKGADPNFRDKEGRTPLHQVLEVGHVLLQKCGANANARDKDGFTPLHIASHNGYHDVVELLLEH